MTTSQIPSGFWSINARQIITTHPRISKQWLWLVGGLVLVLGSNGYGLVQVICRKHVINVHGCEDCIPGFILKCWYVGATTTPVPG